VQALASPGALHHRRHLDLQRAALLRSAQPALQSRPARELRRSEMAAAKTASGQLWGWTKALCVLTCVHDYVGEIKVVRDVLSGSTALRISHLRPGCHSARGRACCPTSTARAETCCSWSTSRSGSVRSLKSTARGRWRLRRFASLSIQDSSVTATSSARPARPSLRACSARRTANGAPSASGF